MRTAFQVPPEQVVEFIKKNPDMRAQDIAKTLRIHYASLWSIAKEFSLTINSSTREVPLEQRIENRIRYIKEQNGEMTLAELARDLGISWSMVHNTCMLHDLPFKRKRKDKAPVMREVHKEQFFNPKLSGEKTWLI